MLNATHSFTSLSVNRQHVVNIAGRHIANRGWWNVRRLPRCWGD